MKKLTFFILANALSLMSFVCVAQNKIQGYEYWFDNDFAGKTITTVTPTQQLTVNQLVSTSGLVSGIHTFNFRSFDNNNVYSSVASSFFYKTSAISTNPNPTVVAYEYWLDNDFANAVTVSMPAQQQVNINELISMTSIANGIHTFNIRFKDNLNIWSSVASSFFYKTTQQTVVQNQVVGYRYWFDNDFTNAVYMPVVANQQVNVMDNLDMTQISKGMHQIHFQIKDTLQQWSVVVTDSVEKISLPIANFAYTPQASCDSTIVQFTNLSVDGDTYFWDFSDGTTDTTANPTHIYNTIGHYLVSLTITDTLTGADNTYQTSLFVIGSTSHSFSVTACNSYTSPSGNYTFITSGTYYDTIPNQWGCDSLLMIMATINHSPSNEVTRDGNMLTANASGVNYQWLDCDNGFSPLANETNQSFTATANGNYAVRVSQNNCADTSICYSITTVGILENTFSNDIIVYPNPTDDMVKIDLGEALSEFNVSLMDVNGKLIRQSTYINTKMFELNLDVQSGVYLLIINSRDKKATIRLVKN